MYVYGTSQIHAAQSLRAPHRAPTAAPSAGTGPSFGVDELDISSEADFVSQVRDLPEIRHDRVAQIRAQIEAGEYETNEKLDMALNRLLDEIG
jgi:negative regulator of flagellin synthesis FlgM